MAITPAKPSNQFTSFQLWLSLAGLCFIIFSAVITFVIKDNSTALTGAQNTTDLAALKIQVSSLSDRFSFLRTEQATIVVQLAQIEAQFCANDEIRNMLHENIARNIAMLWRKVLDMEYPNTNIYYPHICQRQAAKIESNIR